MKDSVEADKPTEAVQTTNLSGYQKRKIALTEVIEEKVPKMNSDAEDKSRTNSVSLDNIPSNSQPLLNPTLTATGFELCTGQTSATFDSVIIITDPSNDSSTSLSSKPILAKLEPTLQSFGFEHVNVYNGITPSFSNSKEMYQGPEENICYNKASGQEDTVSVDKSADLSLSTLKSSKPISIETNNKVPMTSSTHCDNAAGSLSSKQWTCLNQNIPTRLKDAISSSSLTDDSTNPGSNKNTGCAQTVAISSSSKQHRLDTLLSLTATTPETLRPMFSVKHIKIVVVPDKFPHVRMSLKKSDLVRSALIQEICQLKRAGTGPQFLNSFHVPHCGLIVTCANEASKIWLESTVPLLSPWTGATGAQRLRAGTIASVLQLYKVLMQVPEYLRQVSVKDIIAMCRNQNKGMCTDWWVVSNSDPMGCRTVVLIISSQSYSKLKDVNFTIYLGLTTLMLNPKGLCSDDDYVPSMFRRQ